MSTPQDEARDGIPDISQSVQGSTIFGSVTQIQNARDVSITYAMPTSAVMWPVRVGAIPALASAFQTRADLRARIEAARTRNAGVILTQVLAGGGGVGKSQLAAFYAAEAIGGGTDLVMWVDASVRSTVIAAYAQAAARVQAPGITGKTEDDARIFLDWAAVTKRSWLVILDDVADPEQLVGWWPASHTGTGWVMATTRRRDAILTGSGRVLVDVDVYSADESMTYLSQRLEGAGVPHLLDEQADSLAKALGYLPLALSHAAAYMIDQRIRCTTYLARYKAGQERLDQLMPGDPDGHNRRITVTLLLALDAADARDPVGLARPAISLAAALDPNGHPEAFWADDAVTGYLTSHRSPVAGEDEPVPGIGIQSQGWGRNPDDFSEEETAPVTADQARAAIMLLYRYSLVTFDEQAGPRAIRVHALTARATRETASAGQVPRTALIAARAILSLWPDHEHTQPDMVTVLRANAETLYSYSGEALWRPELHPLLNRVGVSLVRAGLFSAAVSYYQRTAADAARILGPDHPDTLTMQGALAGSYVGVGQTDDAIAIGKAAVAEMQRVLGRDHPRTLNMQISLVSAYTAAGRTNDAIAVAETAAPAMEQALGPDHPETLRMQGALAFAYTAAGRIDDAIAVAETAAPAMEQVLGTDHPQTLFMQSVLTNAYTVAGRTDEAIAVAETAAPAMQQALGSEATTSWYLQALQTAAYIAAGRIDDAIIAAETAFAPMQRALGPDHPQVLALQSGLAGLYQQTRKYRQAIDLYTGALAIARDAGDREGEERLLGKLGLCHTDLGEYRQAIDLYTGALAIARDAGDREGEGRLLGNLGRCHASLGNYGQAIDLYTGALAIARDAGDREGEGRLLGNLGLCHASLSDYRQAIDLHTQALAIARDIGNRHGEAYRMGNLGLCHASLGDYRQAIDLHTQALAIAHETDDGEGEGRALGNLGQAWLASGEASQAVARLEEAVNTSADIDEVTEARAWLARAYLHLDNPAAALASTAAGEELACPPAQEPTLRLLEGLALLELDDLEESVRAFGDAVISADVLLILAGGNVAALQARALALSGLAVATGDPGRATEAGEAFARAATSAAGVAADTRRLLDKIIRHDSSGILAWVHTDQDL